MRFYLELEVNRNNTEGILPLNYQYELSSWIYKTLNHGDPEFAEWLHSSGYTNEKKQFKLFTFSQFFIDKYKRNHDRLKILSNKAGLIISFYPIEAIQPFINGLFNKQEFTIGDKFTKTEFKVAKVEKQKAPEFKDEMEFKCISPILLSSYDKDKGGYAQYLAPQDEHYEKLFFNNLKNKYASFYGEKNAFDKTKLSIQLRNTPKSRLVKIKAGTPAESQIKGYQFNFKINAPKELLKIGYHAGFGEKNSIGFGCVEKSFAY